MSNEEFANSAPKPKSILEQTAPVVPMGGNNQNQRERGPFELSKEEQKPEEQKKKDGKSRLVQNAEQTASHTNKVVQGRTQDQKPTTPTPGRG